MCVRMLTRWSVQVRLCCAKSFLIFPKWLQHWNKAPNTCRNPLTLPNWMWDCALNPKQNENKIPFKRLRFRTSIFWFNAFAFWGAGALELPVGIGISHHRLSFLRFFWVCASSRSFPRGHFPRPRALQCWDHQDGDEGVLPSHALGNLAATGRVAFFSSSAREFGVSDLWLCFGRKRFFYHSFDDYIHFTKERGALIASSVGRIFVMLATHSEPGRDSYSWPPANRNPSWHGKVFTEKKKKSWIRVVLCGTLNRFCVDRCASRKCICCMRKNFGIVLLF
jgi:hypothetical protein